MQPPPPEPGRGGSFLGTAAAAAAGVIGGSLMLDGIRGMMGNRGSQGGQGGQALADPAMASGRDGGSPWGGSGAGGNDDLTRALGGDHIGRSEGPSSGEQRQGLFSDDSIPVSDDANNDDSDFDFDDSDSADSGVDD